MEKLFEKYYIPFLFHKIVRCIVFIIFLALLVLSIFACTQLKLGLDNQITVIQDSPTFHYFNVQEKYENVGPPAYIVLKNVDY